MLLEDMGVFIFLVSMKALKAKSSTFCYFYIYILGYSDYSTADDYLAIVTIVPLSLQVYYATLKNNNFCTVREIKFLSRLTLS